MATTNISKKSWALKDCAVTSCDNHGQITKGYCDLHYQRFTTYGDPLKGADRNGYGTTTEARFWSRVKEGENGCLEWQGKVNRDGYGIITIQYKGLAVHRYAWLLKYGNLPEKPLVLRHYECDNPRCVNTDHLRVGTHADNMRDRDSHNRQNRGEDRPNARLSDQKVREIRVLLANGQISRTIANQFDVKVSTINNVRHGKAWKHVT